jgi:hypothetical protein
MRKHTRTTHKFRFKNYPTHIRQPPRNVLEGRAYTAGNDQTKSARQAFNTTKQRETVAALEDAEGQAEDTCGWPEAEGDMEPDRATLADASVPKKASRKRSNEKAASGKQRKPRKTRKNSKQRRGGTPEPSADEYEEKSATPQRFKPAASSRGSHGKKRVESK